MPEDPTGQSGRYVLIKSDFSGNITVLVTDDLSKVIEDCIEFSDVRQWVWIEADKVEGIYGKVTVKQIGSTI